MRYEKQIEVFKNYFKNGEEKKEDYKLGIEFEHFIIDEESLESISYYGKDGVGETLKDLEGVGYEGVYEGGYILELHKGKKHITTEPGSQLEISIDANIDIKFLEEEYLDFLGDIIPILERKNQSLITVGYHPVTKIDEIKLLPKKRYDFMYNYFAESGGTHAHNMMKGTAALQIVIDYSSEEDYIRKFKIINALTPPLYALFENAFYFEGEEAPYHNMRSYIWENCDKDRSGSVPSSLDEDFGYRKYAEYILEKTPIFIMEDGEAVSAEGKTVKELLDPDNYTAEEVEHYLTMFFPDVRTKDYIEIRMMDSVPYPLNIAALALFKGLLYNEENLEKLSQYIEGITIEDVETTKAEMMVEGLDAKLKGETLLEIVRYLVKLASQGLSEEDRKYLEPLEELAKEGKSPYERIKERSSKGRKEALKPCILNSLLEGDN